MARNRLAVLLPMKALFVATTVALGSLACSGHRLALHAPECAPATARTEPTEIEMDPIVGPAPEALVTPFPLGRSTPAAVMTSGMTSELRGRALQGDAGGFVAACTLDRFAVREYQAMSSSNALSTLYVDLACRVRRRSDHALVWQGELRGRCAATASVLFAGDDGSLESRTARMLGDATREVASDLAVRALGLGVSPSARVFRNEAAARVLSGVDDTPLGPAALAEATEGVPPVVASLKDATSPVTRASAWNVVAMAAGPGDPWLAGAGLALDPDVYVRFYQYKALARLGSPSTMAQLKKALANEDEPQLAELLRDSIASGGIGMARSRNASAPTNGSTTRP
jgi:hypothetical protein